MKRRGGPLFRWVLREAKEKAPSFLSAASQRAHRPGGPPSSSTPSPAEKEAASRYQLLLIEDNPDVVEYLSTCLASPSFGTGQGGALRSTSPTTVRYF
ncbi:MAG: hypothetical protein H6559_29145 [Lewinellaceae bacterium]|nr:hypothetical protein [Lewinellaceae bacterium]